MTREIYRNRYRASWEIYLSTMSLVDVKQLLSATKHNKKSPDVTWLKERLEKEIEKRTADLLAAVHC